MSKPKGILQAALLVVCGIAGGAAMAAEQAIGSRAGSAMEEIVVTAQNKGGDYSIGADFGVCGVRCAHG